ncbi:MAG TPA: hypothetical protein VFQ53_09640 [Kofleriaceae bacterium]|nr:hypothetical protein [Kofleriaceae bacterium]
MQASASSKLSRHTIWLFAFGAIIAGIGISYAVAGLGQKVAAGAYFAVVAAAGFASMYFTRARLRGAVLAFLSVATIAAIAYFFLVSHIFATATSTMADAVSGGQAHADGVKAGGVMGHFFGVFVAIIVFLETTIAGIGGAIAGDRSRGKDGGSALAALARSAR